MEILKQDESYLENSDLFEERMFPKGSIKKIKEIAKKYLGKCIYNENLYAQGTHMWWQTLSDDIVCSENSVLDFNTGDFVDMVSYTKKYEKTHCVNQKHWIYSMVQDGMYIFLESFTPEISKKFFDDKDKVTKDKLFPVCYIYFVFKDKRTIMAYAINDWKETKISYHSNNAYVIHRIFSWFTFYEKNVYFYQAKDMFYDFFGSQIVDGNYLDLKKGKDAAMNKFMKEKDPDFSSKNEEITKLNKLVTNYTIPGDFFYTDDPLSLHQFDKKVLFEKYGDVTVIRLLSRCDGFAVEPYRIFVQENAIFSLRYTTCHGFLPATKILHKKLKEYTFKKSEVSDGIEEFKYILPMYEDDEEISILELLTIKQNQIIEQFKKSGFNDLAKYIIEYMKKHSCTIDTAFQILFGKTGSKTNIQNYLGLNRYQLGVVREQLRFDDDMPINFKIYIRAMKYILGTKTLQSLDNNSFDLLWNAITTKAGNIMISSPTKDNDWEFDYSILILKNFYSYYEDVNSTVREFLKTFDLSRYYQRLILDILRMAKSLRYNNLYSGNPFKGIIRDNDVFRRLEILHDNFIITYNAMMNKNLDLSFENKQEEWKKFEFSGNNFSIVVPKRSIELAIEGTELHHCVKSYIQLVSEGKTRIFFIRRNENLNKPFFTVEVDMLNRLQQAHGICNCNVDTEPGLQEFIEEWAKEKNIKLVNYDNVLAARERD